MGSIWWPVALTATIAFCALEADRRLALKQGGAIIEIVTGAAGVLFGLAAGLYLRQTFVGRSWVPGFVHLSNNLRILVTIGVILGVAAAVLAVLPGTWSPTMAVTPGLVILVMLVPSLLPYSVPSGATHAVAAVVDVASKPAMALARAVL